MKNTRFVWHYFLKICQQTPQKWCLFLYFRGG